MKISMALFFTLLTLNSFAENGPEYDPQNNVRVTKIATDLVRVNFPSRKVLIKLSPAIQEGNLVKVPVQLKGEESATGCVTAHFSYGFIISQVNYETQTESCDFKEK